MFVATDNLLADADAATAAASVEWWLRKSFFGAKFVRDLFFETFFLFTLFLFIKTFNGS